MNKLTRTYLLNTSILLAATTHAPGQGTAFTYQGRLNSGTNVASGSYDLKFTLYDAASSGNVVAGPITNSLIAITNGLFSVVLDFGSSPFNGADRWLKVSARTNGNTAFTDLAPLQKLTPSPYAIYSGTAATSSLANAVASNSVTGTGIASATINAGNIASGQVVKSLNGLRDAVTISAGSNIVLTPSGNNIQISDPGASFWNLKGNGGTVAGTNFLGTTDNQALELKVNGHRAMRLEPTVSSPNVIGGYEGNTVNSNAVGAAIGGGGTSNALNVVDTLLYGILTNSADFAAIGGGSGNLVRGSTLSTIVGGSSNYVVGDHYGKFFEENVIAGGAQNRIQETLNSTIVGGQSNSLGGFNAGVYTSTIGGGIGNVIAGNDEADGASVGTIAGGANNRLQADYNCTIGGGLGNYISAHLWGGVISGGTSNNVGPGSSYSTVVGGAGNLASGMYGTVVGGSQNQSGGDGPVVGGANNTNWSAGGAIVGGYSNFVQGTGVTIGAGQNNRVTGLFGAVLGGASNAVSTDFGTVAGGQANTVSASNGVVVGGQSNSVTAVNGTIPGGAQAVASNYGQFAYASGAFAKAGDAQSSVYVCRGTTTNNTQTELFLDGLASRMNIPSNTTWSFNALISGRSSSGSSAGYELHGVIKNTGGTVSVVGTVTGTVLAEDVTTWDATLTADSVNKALAVKVIGATSTNIRWVATVRTTEVSY